MEKKLESKDLKPNSLYQVTITLDGGDKVIDSLRSFTTEVPKIFTTDISTTTTTSSLIPVKKYINYKTKDADPGTPIAVTNVNIGTVKLVSSSSKSKWNKKIHDSVSYIVDVYITSSGLPEIDTLVTIIATTPGWSWLNGSYVVTPGKDSDFWIKGTFTPGSIEPGLAWQVSGTGMSATGSYYVPASSPLDKIDKASTNIAGKIYFTNTKSYKPPTAAVYEDRVAIVNTVKTAITNAEVITSLTWENDIVKDIPFFFFTDKSGTVAKKDYLYMYSSSSLSVSNFVAGTPNSKNNNLFNNATGLTLAEQTAPPAYNANNSIFTGATPAVTNELVVFQTVNANGIGANATGFPTKMQVAYSIARYTKQSDGTWKAEWIQKDQDGYPILSTPEVITGV
jgi:hypothetical protein